MRNLFLLAIMLTGSFAFANNFDPNVSSERNEENVSITQTDVLSVQSDDSFLSTEEIRCFIKVCNDDGCTGWIEVPCNVTIIIVISPDH